MDLFDLSQFGIAIFTVGAMTYMIKKFLCFMKHQETNFNKIITNHLHDSTEANNRLERSHQEFSMVIKELLSFLRANNGNKNERDSQENWEY